MLAWGLTGWLLAAALGVLLFVHVTSRDQPVPQSPATPPPEAAPVVETPQPETPRERAPLADASTTVAPVEPGIPIPSTQPADVESERSPSNDVALIAAYLRHAAVFTEAGEFRRAIEAYDRALELDPENDDFALLRAQVVIMRDSGKRGGLPKPLAIRESRTEYVSPPSGVDSQRFSAGGVSVRRATEAPEFPGELVVSLRPQIIEPDDPYVVSVRLYNKGNRVIGVEHVEVVFEFSGRSEGRGDRHAPMVRRANPRDTSLIWEKQGVWAEGQTSGDIAVVVHLVGGAQLKKTISW